MPASRLPAQLPTLLTTHPPCDTHTRTHTPCLPFLALANHTRTTHAHAQASMAQLYDENERHFNSVPLVRFTGIVSCAPVCAWVCLCCALMWC
jgi:hypothetical protein